MSKLTIEELKTILINRRMVFSESMNEEVFHFIKDRIDGEIDCMNALIQMIDDPYLLEHFRQSYGDNNGFD
jgi:hypothetical protein